MDKTAFMKRIAPDEISGLVTDYINVWSPINIFHIAYKQNNISESDFLKELDKSMRTYEKYCRDKKYPGELLRKAKPKYEKRLDEIVEQYNKLPEKDKLNYHLFASYLKSVEELIGGKLVKLDDIKA